MPGNRTEIPPTEQLVVDRAEFWDYCQTKGLKLVRLPDNAVGVFGSYGVRLPNTKIGTITSVYTGATNNDQVNFLFQELKPTLEILNGEIGPIMMVGRYDYLKEFPSLKAGYLRTLLNVTNLCGRTVAIADGTLAGVVGSTLGRIVRGRLVITNDPSPENLLNSLGYNGIEET